MKKLHYLKLSLYILVSIIFLLTALYFFVSYPNKIKVKKGLIETTNYLIFKEKTYENLQKKIDQNILISKFGELSIKKTELEQRDFFKPLGYLDIVDGKTIFLVGNGDLLLFDNLSKKKIKSNLKYYFNNEIKKDELFTPFVINPIRDLLFHDGFLYVVFLDVKIIDGVTNFSSSVLKGKFNSDYINFSYFFKPEDFLNEENSIFPIDFTHAGGRITVDKDNNFFIAVPDYAQQTIVQDLTNIYGKVLQIQSLTDYKIISIGHRNPQGLYYDKEKEILIESEHGPSGGDEINLIKPNQNYGYPRVSSGIGTEASITIYHNHKKHGYYPPLYTWPVWNPGISQIIKIKESSKFNFRGLYIAASLSGYNRFYGNHLYLFNIDKDKAVIKDKIFVGDRVRDLVYDEINDKIIITLENQEAIGVITTKN